MQDDKKIHFDVRLQREFESLLNKEVLLNKSAASPVLPVNSYLLFLEKFKGDKLYEFEIFGANGTYQPVFKINDGIIYSACNCALGIRNKLCWHRSYIINGKTKQISKGNHHNNLEKMIEELKTSRASSFISNVKYSSEKSGNINIRKMSMNSFFMFFSSLF